MRVVESALYLIIAFCTAVWLAMCAQACVGDEARFSSVSTAENRRGIP